MTHRLYLDDPYLSRFSARVLAARELDGKPAVVLDRSAFYPEGGGQPADRGHLGGVAVLDVQERGGEVLHALERPLLEGAEVEGSVDWARRLDHMQQHHGQHLLSAAFEKVHAAPTVSFHLGERSCTIDLDCSVSKLDGPALRAAEAAANESVWRDHPVVARDFTGDERAALPLRKEAVKGDRVVLVEGVDASPCGGTHPRRTGEVGAIAVLRAQKWGAGKARVEFVCGGRVVRLLGELHGQVSAAAEAFKSAPAELADAARRSVADSQARRKAIEALESELAGHLAAQLASTTPTGPVVARLSRGAGMARAVASALVTLGRTALVATVDEGRAHLCFARPKGPDQSMSELLKAALATLSGKGGGSAEFATGSGEPARLDEALAASSAQVRP